MNSALHCVEVGRQHSSDPADRLLKFNTSPSRAGMDLSLLAIYPHQFLTCYKVKWVCSQFLNRTRFISGIIALPYFITAFKMAIYPFILSPSGFFSVFPFF